MEEVAGEVLLRVAAVRQLGMLRTPLGAAKKTPWQGVQQLAGSTRPLLGDGIREEAFRIPCSHHILVVPGIRIPEVAVPDIHTLEAVLIHTLACLMNLEVVLIHTLACLMIHNLPNLEAVLIHNLACLMNSEAVLMQALRQASQALHCIRYRASEELV